MTNTRKLILDNSNITLLDLADLTFHRVAGDSWKFHHLDLQDSIQEFDKQRCTSTDKVIQASAYIMYNTSY